MSKDIAPASEVIRASRVADRHPERVAELEALVRPIFQVSSHPPVPERLALGTSRLGGPADLPAGVAYPTCDGRPMALLAQLDFPTLGVGRNFELPMDMASWPTLCLFLDAAGGWSGNGADGDGFAAIQFDRAAGELVRHTPLPPDGARFWTHCCIAEVGRTGTGRRLPEFGNVEGPAWAGSYDADQQAIDDPAYAALCGAIQNGPHGRGDVTLLGYPTLYNPDPRHYEADSPGDWTLLAEIAANSPSFVADVGGGGVFPGLDLGDFDFLQYFVRHDDLAAGRLDRGFFATMGT